MKKLAEHNLSFKITSVRDYDKETVLITTAVFENKEAGRVMELFHTFPKSYGLSYSIERAKLAAVNDYFGEDASPVVLKGEVDVKLEEGTDVKVIIGDTPVEKVKTPVKKKARKKRTVAKKAEKVEVPVEETQDAVLEVISPTVVYDSTNASQKLYIAKLMDDKYPGWRDDKVQKAKIFKVVAELKTMKCFYESGEPTELLMDHLENNLFKKA